MEKIHRAFIFTFSMFLLSAISFSDGLGLHNSTSSAKFKLSQEYSEPTKWQTGHENSNSNIDKKDKTALIGGIGLASSFALTAVIGVAIASEWGYTVTPYYLIPVVGPFLQIPTTGGIYTTLCIIGGAVQTVFSVVLVYGLIKNKKPTKKSSFQIVWAPIVSKNKNGFMLGLRF